MMAKDKNLHSKVLVKDIWSYIFSFILLLLPTILLLVSLVYLFPYTGLGRIVSIPSTIIINSLVIVLCLFISNKVLWIKISKTLITILITIWITIAGYPQEFNPPVLAQIKNAINAVQAIDSITKKDLNVNGNVSNSRYVVALYKYRDEILDDGTYQLYQQDNVYFYNSINNLNEIGSKLIGYHKVMWWYLDCIRDGSSSSIKVEKRKSNK
ncbi:hypothetical protein [Paenibacillus sp. P46E]|uniref:hypothetical protein n=1 Tax=Paenibacillus sp. P46E TaxID=1349436 RepID=UPI0009395187|nr:hypothetical protein [Paenibacillus sp. P46E]OKP94389.1 hypothetical protein A3849_29280 [Paenibacillus sp. P46E]